MAPPLLDTTRDRSGTGRGGGAAHFLWRRVRWLSPVVRRLAARACAWCTRSAARTAAVTTSFGVAPAHHPSTNHAAAHCHRHHPDNCPAYWMEAVSNEQGCRGTGVPGMSRENRGGLAFI